MKKLSCATLLLLILFSVKSFAGNEVPGDTIVTKIVDGKKYIMHRVDVSEGWLAIARSYGITYTVLRNSNKEVADKLAPDQIIKVPFASTRYSDSKSVRNYKQQSQAVYYKVQEGESMMSIAEQNSTEVDSLMKWNKAKTANLKKGNKIIIGYNTTYINTGRAWDEQADAKLADNAKDKKENTKPKTADEKVEAKRDEMIAKENEKKVAEEKKAKEKEDRKNAKADEKATADAKSAAIKAEAKLADGKGVNKTLNKTTDVSKAKTETAVATKTPDKPKADVVADNAASKLNTNGKRKALNEKGVAVWVQEEEYNNSKFYALHRTAPIGTIIKVTNSMNNKYVYVKVVGTLPATGDNDGLIIKISKASADKAGVIDQKFQCELDYGINQ